MQKISLCYRALLQKRPIILRSLLIEATPYVLFWQYIVCAKISIQKRTEDTVLAHNTQCFRPQHILSNIQCSDIILCVHKQYAKSAQTLCEKCTKDTVLAHNTQCFRQQNTLFQIQCSHCRLRVQKHSVLCTFDMMFGTHFWMCGRGVDMHDATHSYMCGKSLLIHMCAVTHSHVWRDSFDIHSNVYGSKYTTQCGKEAIAADCVWLLHKFRMTFVYVMTQERGRIKRTNLYMYMCIHKFIYIYTYMYTHTNMHIYMNMYVHISLKMGQACIRRRLSYIYACTHTQRYIYTCMCMYTYLWQRGSTHTQQTVLHICIYTYTNI